jgi:hypothetical protein
LRDILSREKVNTLNLSKVSGLQDHCLSIKS